MQIAIVIGKAQRLDSPACLRLMAQYVRHFSTVAAGADYHDSFGQNQAPLRRLPLNSCAVACPGWLIPSRRTRLTIVKAIIFTSSQND